MESALFYGSATALITPFNQGQVDCGALERLIDLQIVSGTDALVVLGTTGEPCSLSPKERRLILECAVERCAGRMPVIAGTGSNDTQTAILHSVEAERIGADGLLVVTPYYNRANQEGVARHFLEIADRVTIPMILYNVPSRTGMCLQPETVAHLARHPLIRGVKDAHKDMEHLMRLSQLCGDGMAIYAGNDAFTLPMLSMGARGVISVAGNVVPGQMHDMVAAWLEGDYGRSLELHRALFPLWEALGCDVNPIPIKAACAYLLEMENELRLPLTPLSVEKTAALIGELRALIEQGS